MKRYLLSSLVFLLLLPVGASAQWYLFPGGRHAKDSSGVKTSDNTFVPLRDESQKKEAAIDFEFEEEEEVEAVEAVHAARVSLILPLKSTGTPNSNFLDFYSGVLMAANSLSEGEKPIELSVYDSTVGMPSISELEQSDLIIGPVNFDDVQRLLPRARGKLIVSPLDPKVASLTGEASLSYLPLIPRWHRSPAPKTLCRLPLAGRPRSTNWCAGLLPTNAEATPWYCCRARTRATEK